MPTDQRPTTAIALGHLIPGLLGAADLAAGAWSLSQGGPGVLTATLLVVGVLLPMLAWSSFCGSRPAWAFLVAICGVFAVIEFFGAPKIRDTLGISLGLAMILPLLNTAAAVALVSLRDRYVDGAPSPA